MTSYVPIGGTHDWVEGEVRWWHPSSRHSSWMLSHGYKNVRPEDPFWSTAPGGVGDGHRVWRFGSNDTADFLRSIPFEDRNCAALSHAGQVLAYVALLHEIPLRSVVTIGTPVRKDMTLAYNALVARSERWTHVSEAHWWGDWMQLAGALFDKGLRFRRSMKLDGVTDLSIKGVGHSRIVRDPAYFDTWITAGILDRF